MPDRGSGAFGSDRERVGSNPVSGERERRRGYPRPQGVAAVPLETFASLTNARVAVASAKGTGTTVTGVTHDSTAVHPGDLYAALPGARRHGAEFALDAVR